MSCALVVSAPVPAASAGTEQAPTSARAVPGPHRLAAGPTPDEGGPHRGRVTADGPRRDASEHVILPLPPLFDSPLFGTRRGHHDPDGPAEAVPGGGRGDSAASVTPGDTPDAERADRTSPEMPVTEAGPNQRRPGTHPAPVPPPPHTTYDGGRVSPRAPMPYDGGTRGADDAGPVPPPASTSVPGGAWSPAPVAPHDAHDAVAGAAEPAEGDPEAGDTGVGDPATGEPSSPRPPHGEAAASVPATPVLPLGFGLVSLGLGLAFLALRLRRG